MKHHALEQLQIVSQVDQDYPHKTLLRSERLERWAMVLERDPDRRLSTLYQSEYQPARERAAMRSEGSPISVAFEDPVLRATGLKNDTYGEARRFFELSDLQLHRVVCYCHFGAEVSAGMAAYNVRKAIAGRHKGLIAWLRDVLDR